MPDIKTTTKSLKAANAANLSNTNEMKMQRRSNYICLQLQEILKSYRILQKHEQEIEIFLKDLHDKILQFPELPSRKLIDIPWLKTDVTLPGKFPPNLDVSVCWFPPTDVKLLGSYQLKTILKENINVDVVLEMPKKCLHHKAYLNYHYHVKRSCYLAYVAYQLKKLDYNVCFSYFMEDLLKPVILLTLPGTLEFVTVRFHVTPPSEYFNESKFLPGSKNFSKSFSETVMSDVKNMKLVSALYNSSILIDIKMSFHLTFIHQLIKDNKPLQDTVKLLKLWLKRHQFDQGFGCFSGFLMSMFVMLLLYTNKLNRTLNCFQMFRFVLKSLSLTKWTEVGASFDSAPNISVFHDHFEVVFLDPSGQLNLCAFMSGLFYNQVVHEANVTIELLDKQQNEVYKIFTESTLFELKFDSILCIANLEQAQEEQVSFENHIAAILPTVNEMLKKGLGQKVELIGIKPHSSKPWQLNQAGSDWFETAFNLGLLLNYNEADEPLIIGPSADLPQANEFREFWGDVADLRRFKDGSICEAVLWEGKNVPEQICKHLLQKYCGISLASISTSSFDEMLVNESGSSEDNGAEVRIVFQDLCNQLTSFNSLPLSITNIYGLSPVLRSTEVFPPRKITKSASVFAVKSSTCSFLIPLPDQELPVSSQTSEMLCFFESSGKWPQEHRAIERVKAAFHEAICKELCAAGLPAYATARHVCAHKDGFSFKIRVGYQREVSVLQSQVTETGLHKKRENPESLALETQLFHLPRTAVSLEGVSRKFGAFGDTCRLAKRWLSSHLLSNHFNDETVDLLCAHLFLHPIPYVAPSSAQSGFLRFLCLLATFPFKSAPLLIDFKAALSDGDQSAIISHFNTNRDVLPPMCVFTSINQKLSLWTEQKPSAVVLNRMRRLAKFSFDQLIKQYSAISSVDIQSVFTPSMKSYDALIYLRHDYAPDYGLKPEKVLPVVDFNAISIYLQQLEESFSEFAIFFYDRFSNSVIAVLWRPAAFEAVPFKLMSLPCRKLDEHGNLVPNLDAIIEDFKVLGRGLVDSIELRTDKWRI